MFSTEDTRREPKKNKINYVSAKKNDRIYHDGQQLHEVCNYMLDMFSMLLWYKMQSLCVFIQYLKIGESQPKEVRAREVNTRRGEFPHFPLALLSTLWLFILLLAAKQNTFNLVVCQKNYEGEDIKLFIVYCSCCCCCFFPLRCFYPASGTLSISEQQQPIHKVKPASLFFLL